MLIFLRSAVCSLKANAVTTSRGCEGKSDNVLEYLELGKEALPSLFWKPRCREMEPCRALGA